MRKTIFIVIDLNQILKEYENLRRNWMKEIKTLKD